MTDENGSHITLRRWFQGRLVTKTADWIIVGLLWAALVTVVAPLRDRAAAIWDMPNTQESLSVRMNALAARVETLAPVQHVSEYDLLRSRVIEPCTKGQTCRYNIRARRTDFGEFCGSPAVLARVVTDRNGLQHFVDPAPSLSGPRRIDDDWTNIPLAFIAPIEAPVGVAEFELHLAYDCDGETVEERTPRIVFQLTEQ